MSVSLYVCVCLCVSVEDIKLNSTVFHWPDSLTTVFEVNQSRLANRRERAEEDLRKKIAAFEEKLAEHNKEIETFQKKEVKCLLFIKVTWMYLLTQKALAV